jgi:2-polyprenyl-6-methoxyphenol hydroxylase-like FAD-dependent oxidoreductase
MCPCVTVQGLAYPLKAQILIGADGPFSGVRAQCVQDGEPAFDVSDSLNMQGPFVCEHSQQLSLCMVPRAVNKLAAC